MQHGPLPGTPPDGESADNARGGTADNTAAGELPADVYLLGRIDFDQALALQQRLVYEAGGRRAGRVSLVLCEHPDCISVGRGGSWAHIRMGRRELESRRLQLHWIGRGGGCLPHAPGQLAVYPIVPLALSGLSLGGYLRRLHAAAALALGELGVEAQPRPGSAGLWGRSGQLVALGVAVRNWTTCHGLFVNVSPALGWFHRVVSDPAGRTPMSSLAAERRGPLAPSRVREALVRQLTLALGCSRYQVFSGYPLWARSESGHAPTARAG